MPKERYVFAASRPFYASAFAELKRRFPGRFVWIQRPQELTIERLAKISPRYIFFPHWSSFIPEDIYGHYECVIFHMTDLPFGRGGSPLQNLILRGAKRTKISALQCSPRLDAGPIYLKRPLSLEGSAQEIFGRTALIVTDMIRQIIRDNPIPKPQKGNVVVFKRRRPSQSNLAAAPTTPGAYDLIRMLDADGYPRAFLETEHLRFEFRNASVSEGKVQAHVTITKK